MMSMMVHVQVGFNRIVWDDTNDDGGDDDDDDDVKWCATMKMCTVQASFNHFLEMMRSERNRMDDSSPLCYHIELVSIV